MTVFDCQSYRDILRRELTRRITNNARYSLRAFARDLGVAPSQLSEVFARKQGFSLAAADEISRRLSFNEQEKSYFCSLVTAEHARSQAAREAARRNVERLAQQQQARPYSLDVFNYIANWYHSAIVELTLCKGFKSDPHWIAQKLGISVAEAKEAIDRLLSLGLLVQEDATLHRVDDALVSFPTEIPSASIKEAHRQLILKSIEALYCQPIQERDYSSVIMAIDEEKIDEAKAIIHDFRRKLLQVMTGGDKTKRTKVYCLSTQLFSLEKNH